MCGISVLIIYKLDPDTVITCSMHANQEINKSHFVITFKIKQGHAHYGDASLKTYFRALLMLSLTHI